MVWPCPTLLLTWNRKQGRAGSSSSQPPAPLGLAAPALPPGRGSARRSGDPQPRKHTQTHIHSLSQSQEQINTARRRGRPVAPSPSGPRRRPTPPGEGAAAAPTGRAQHPRGPDGPARRPGAATARAGWKAEDSPQRLGLSSARSVRAGSAAGSACGAAAAGRAPGVRPPPGR